MIIAILLLILAVLLFGSSVVLGVIGQIIGLVTLIIGITFLSAATNIDPVLLIIIIPILIFSLLFGLLYTVVWVQENQIFNKISNFKLKNPKRLDVQEASDDIINKNSYQKESQDDEESITANNEKIYKHWNR